MGRIARIITVVVFCALSAAILDARAEEQSLRTQEGMGVLSVEIDYGGLRPSRTVEVSPAEGKTALEVLQTIAIVETSPVGQYVFVTSIDGISGKRGEKAWYYTVDDKSPGELAYSKTLNGAEHIKWFYIDDVCSSVVDEKPGASGKGGGQR